MTQVAIAASPTSGSWDNSATPTINTPAGVDKDRQLLVIATSLGGTVTAPAISGWTLEAQSFMTGTQARFAIYSRVCSGVVGASTASPTYSSAVYGLYWAGSMNGELPAITMTQDPGWGNPRTIPATTSPSIESLHFVAAITTSWPRQVVAVSGYTETYDALNFIDAVYGLSMAIETKNVGSGAVASSSWTYREYDDSVDLEDLTIYASIVVTPLSAVATGAFTITAAFPVVGSITLSRANSNPIDVGESDPLVVTVLDQDGDPIQNATLTIAPVAGGVFEQDGVLAIVTDAAGEATFDIVGVSPGTASLQVGIANTWSNAQTIVVLADSPAYAGRVRRAKVRRY